MKKTPLYEDHIQLGARMVEFAGWQMPIQYSNLKDEHLTVRNHVGLFDVSHMGEFRLKGPRALETLQWLTTNNIAALEEDQAQYSLLPNSCGGLVDDIIVYCLKKNEDYLVCVNAANVEKDWKHFQENNKGAELVNESLYWAQIAVQGPKAFALLDSVLKINSASMKSFSLKKLNWNGHSVIFATTGYTGEKGGEIFIENKGASDLWKTLLQTGQDFGVKPIGLGARDSLRTEMKMSLYGHEIDDTTNPYEASLGWAIKPQAKDFLAKDIITKVKETGLTRSLIGFKMIDRGIPRQGYTLHDENDQEIGIVTSGTHSPTLDEPIGIGYVRPEFSQVGSFFYVDIRGKKTKASTCKTPFIAK